MRPNLANRGGCNAYRIHSICPPAKLSDVAVYGVLGAESRTSVGESSMVTGGALFNV